MSSFSAISSAPISSLLESGTIYVEDIVQEITVTQSVAVSQVSNFEISDFLTLTQTALAQTIYNVLISQNANIQSTIYAAQNYTVDIVDNLTISDQIINVYDYDIIDELIISETEDGSVNSTLTETLIIDQTITNIQAFLFSVPQTLAFTQEADAGLVFNFVICQQLLLTQKVSQVTEIDVSQDVEFNLFEVDTVSQDLELDQTVETNIQYSCLSPEGKFNEDDLDVDLSVSQGLSVLTVYNVGVVQTTTINHTVMRILV